jgi:hypothetical protein
LRVIVRTARVSRVAGALDAHLGSEHVQAILARADELFADGGDIVVYEAVPGGETKKGSLAEHAAG